MIVEIPCQIYIKKFLVKVYDSEPIKLSKKEHLGFLIYNILEKVPFDYKPKKVSLLESSIKFNLMKDNNLDRRNLYISDDCLCKFNNIFAGMFRDSFRFWVQEREWMGLANYSAIQEFMKLFDLEEEDINMETLIKDYSRYKKNRYNKKRKFIMITSRNIIEKLYKNYDLVSVKCP